MGNMIVPDHQIKTRRYNLLIDGNIVEECLSPRMANILANEYRSEGFRVDKVEVFTVTKGIEIVGEKMDEEFHKNDPEVGMPYKGLNTPTLTDAKVKRDRNNTHVRAEAIRHKHKNHSDGIRYTEYGRDRRSSLHSMYLDNVRRNGYRVFNRLNNQVWIGLQKEVAEKIFSYINNGGKKSDLDIKYLGSN